MAAAVFSFAAATLLILAITWPWVLHFSGEFLNHWDPPFHAWKLEFMARRILAGDIFISTGNTNMLYPHSGALYFEALQWPMALFAAPFFALTALPSEAIYHVTLLFFWALSAPCMYFLLRELACRMAPAVAGAVVFCILPWRISYMVEFQMEMVFALPLFFGFIIRFFHGRRVSDAILAAFSLWLFAVSELYQAISAAMAAPVFAIAFVAWRPRILKSRRFWIATLAASFVGVALLCLLLLPYATLHTQGQVLRPLGEVACHSVQPFSYLIPFGRHNLWTIDARRDEFSLYPTIAVMSLAVGGAIYWLAHFVASRRHQPFRLTIGIIAFASGIMFSVVASVMQFCQTASSHFLLRSLKYSSLVFLASSVVLAVSPRKDDSRRCVFLKALFAVSVFFLFLSFGPNISFGSDAHRSFEHPNPIFLFCYNTLMPFLSGFRVVSRFGIIVLFFLVCVSAVSLDKILVKLSSVVTTRINATRRSRFLRFVAPLSLAAVTISLVVLETIPSSKNVYTYRPVDDQRAYPTIKKLLERHPIVTLAIAPAGPRHIEGMRMFSLLKGDWPYIYVWGGFFPEFSRRLIHTLMSFDTAATHRELARFFPPCILVVDNAEPVFPKQPISGKYAKDINRRKAVDFVALYSEIADIVDADERFTIMKLRPLPPAFSSSRIFRSDIASRNPLLSCAVSGMPGTSVVFSLNGEPIAKETLPQDGTLHFNFNIAPNLLSDEPFNIFEVVSSNASPVSMDIFSLVSRDGTYDDIFAPYSPYNHKETIK